MNKEFEIFKSLTKSTLSDLSSLGQEARGLGCDSNSREKFDKAISAIKCLEERVSSKKIKVNYLKQFNSIVEGISLTLDRGKNMIDPYESTEEQELRKSEEKKELDRIAERLYEIVRQLEFKLKFFDQINYFDGNVVAIGANGSGKTTLSKEFKSHLQDNLIVIPAQRILLIPTFDSIANTTTTESELREAQLRDKTFKDEKEFKHLEQEFGIILRNLLADNISAGHRYRKSTLQQMKDGKAISEPEVTDLDRSLTIWNSLMEHRKINCPDGINISAVLKDGKPYPAVQMSDGEKVMLYHITQVLQAPENGFIIIDEPETYLHKTITKKLWDKLEAQRPDCNFIYLTHDLDFATSRSAAKKIWIKSFTPPDDWEIEDVPESDIPDALLYELLGSNKDILFCEGGNESDDIKIYSTILPELTIKPVGGCGNVINYTKAFNQLDKIEIKTRAFGLIDSDYHEEDRLGKLEKRKVFAIDVSEVENLLLNEDFLKIFWEKQDSISTDAIGLIKEGVIAKLGELKDAQVANFVSTKINNYFKDSHVSKGNDLDSVESHFESFTSKVNIKYWYEARESQLDGIISNKKYLEAIKVFNDKGLSEIVAKHFKIKAPELKKKSLELLHENKEARKSILDFLPEEIREAGTHSSVE